MHEVIVWHARIVKWGTWFNRYNFGTQNQESELNSTHLEQQACPWRSSSITQSNIGWLQVDYVHKAWGPEFKSRVVSTACRVSYDKCRCSYFLPASACRHWCGHPKSPRPGTCCLQTICWTHNRSRNGWGHCNASCFIVCWTNWVPECYYCVIWLLFFDQQSQEQHLWQVSYMCHCLRY